MIYSTRFLAHGVDSTAHATAALYTVPTGKLAVIRCIDLVCMTAGLVYVGHTAGGGWVWLETTQGLVANQSRHVETRQVVPAGQQVKCLWVSGDCAVSVSGYLFSAP